MSSRIASSGAIPHVRRAVLLSSALLATNLVVMLPANADSRCYIEGGRLFFAAGEGGYQVGLRLAPTEEGAAFDFATAALVDGLRGGVIFLVPDLDATYAIPLGEKALLAPRAGISGLLLIGGGYSLFSPGVNAGAGLALYPRGPVSVRLDYTVRAFAEKELKDEGSMQSATVGVSWTLPN